MISDKYSKYLTSKKWKEKRRLVLDRDGHKCRMCPSDKNLQAHHITYDRIFNEDLNDLITLCSKCHDEIHGNNPSDHLKKLQRIIINKQADFARRELKLIGANKWFKDPYHMKNEEAIKFYKKIFKAKPESGAITKNQYDKRVLEYRINPGKFNGKKPVKKAKIKPANLFDNWIQKQNPQQNHKLKP